MPTSYLFERIKECDLQVLKTAFLLILVFMIKQVKSKVNRRKWILAINTHYEPFYGNTTGLWIHAYKPEKKECKESYKFITINLVVGRIKILSCSPCLSERSGGSLHRRRRTHTWSQKKHVKIELVLFDRGIFYAAKLLCQAQRAETAVYILFAPQLKTRLISVFLKKHPHLSRGM